MPPGKPKFVAYMRVSTHKQGRSGLGLEAQQAAVASFLRQVGGIDLAPGRYVEVESGKRSDRPQLARALLHCQQTGATLVVAKLDRLSRNVAFLMTLRDSGARFKALDLPEGIESNALTLTVMAGMAQHEREMISKRTKDALAARKARGQVLGNPGNLAAWRASASAKQLKAVSVSGMEVRQDAARQWAQGIAARIEEARGAGRASLRQIAAWLNENGFTTHRGAQWTAAAVQRVLRLSATPTGPHPPSHRPVT